MIFNWLLSKNLLFWRYSWPGLGFHYSLKRFLLKTLNFRALACQAWGGPAFVRAQNQQNIKNLPRFIWPYKAWLGPNRMHMDAPGVKGFKGGRGWRGVSPTGFLWGPGIPKYPYVFYLLLLASFLGVPTDPPTLPVAFPRDASGLSHQGLEGPISHQALKGPIPLRRASKDPAFITWSPWGSYRLSPSLKDPLKPDHFRGLAGQA